MVRIAVISFYCGFGFAVVCVTRSFNLGSFNSHSFLHTKVQPTENNDGENRKGYQRSASNTLSEGESDTTGNPLKRVSSLWAPNRLNFSRDDVVFENPGTVDKRVAWLGEAIAKEAHRTTSILELTFCDNSGSDCKTSLGEKAAADLKVRGQKLVVRDITKGLEADYWDMIIAVDVLNRVVDPVNSFREIAKSLVKDGGVFLVTTSFSGNFRPRVGSDSPPILAKHGQTWYEKMASEYGLKTTSVWSQGQYSTYLGELQRRVTGCQLAKHMDCRGRWHRGFFFRLQRENNSVNSGSLQRVLSSKSKRLQTILPPPFGEMNNSKATCITSNASPDLKQKSVEAAEWLKHYKSYGNPGTRDVWIKKLAEKYCSAGKGQPVGSQSRPKVLDVSAGSRPYKPIFEEAGCRYFSNEFGGNSVIIDHFRRETKKNLAMHDYLGPDVTNTTAPSDSFDIVMLTEVLEHVPNAFGAIRELKRVAKKGADILVTSPLTSGPHQMPHHFVAGYSSHWYEAVASYFQLEVVSLSSQGDVFDMIVQECRRQNHRDMLPREESSYLSAALTPEHALGWMAHFRK